MPISKTLFLRTASSAQLRPDCLWRWGGWSRRAGVVCAQPCLASAPSWPFVQPSSLVPWGGGMFACGFASHMHPTNPILIGTPRIFLPCKSENTNLFIWLLLGHFTHCPIFQQCPVIARHFPKFFIFNLTQFFKNGLAILKIPLFYFTFNIYLWNWTN